MHRPFRDNRAGFFYFPVPRKAMRGNDAKHQKDKIEEWAYRLSMDQQLTEPHPRIVLFIEKYLEWYMKKAGRNGTRLNRQPN